MATLELQELSKEFSGKKIVQDLNLAVEDGEFISLLGPSGCGKTTTLRMIAGLETLSSGQVLVDGKRVDHLPVNKRDTLLVFQNYALFPHMTVSQNLAFGLRYRGVPKNEHRERIERILAIVQLQGYESRRPGQLSGGQQQRVALARSLILNPSVLLLDEPLSNLDRKLRDEMRFEILRIQKELGITTILVTHDQEEALSMSDRIVMMNRGRIEQVSDAYGIYDQPATYFVSDFLGRANLLPTVRVESAEDVLQPVLHLDGYSYVFPLTDENGAQVPTHYFHAKAENIEILPPQVPQEDLDKYAFVRPAHIERVVPLGDRIEVHLTMDGREILALRARDEDPIPGSSVLVCITQKWLSVIDAPEDET